MSNATPDPEHAMSNDELADEYEFDYSNAKPNRFASRTEQNGIVVTLDPDVSHVFKTPEAVNHALRTLIQAMPDSTASS